MKETVVQLISATVEGVSSLCRCKVVRIIIAITIITVVNSIA